MSNAKARYRRRRRAVFAEIRSEMFRRMWESSGGIDGYFALMFQDPLPAVMFARHQILEKLERKPQG